MAAPDTVPFSLETRGCSVVLSFKLSSFTATLPAFMQFKARNLLFVPARPALLLLSFIQYVFIKHLLFANIVPHWIWQPVSKLLSMYVAASNVELKHFHSIIRSTILERA